MRRRKKEKKRKIQDDASQRQLRLSRAARSRQPTLRPVPRGGRSMRSALHQPPHPRCPSTTPPPPAAAAGTTVRTISIRHAGGQIRRAGLFFWHRRRGDTRARRPFLSQKCLFKQRFFRRQENVGDLGLLYGAPRNGSGQPFRADSLFIFKLRCAAAGCIMLPFDGI